MKGTLEPSAPSIIPNPCASIFFTIPVILSVLPVQPFWFSISLGHWLGKKLLHPVFFPGMRHEELRRFSRRNQPHYCKISVAIQVLCTTRSSLTQANCRASAAPSRL